MEAQNGGKLNPVKHRLSNFQPWKGSAMSVLTTTALLYDGKIVII